MTILLIVALILAAIPFVLFLWNLRLFAPPPLALDGDVPAVSVLIPARNEEANIGACVERVLQSRGVSLEVLVYDDRSTDATAAMVKRVSQRNKRVRLLPGPELPKGWNGKQHACYVLARESRAKLLFFLDADVRVEPDAIVRMVAFLQGSRAALVSGFPRQITETFLERLLLPLIHWVLLGLLPFAGMRRSNHPRYAAGCGQVFLARREAYEASGGHARIRASRHDGIALPLAFRVAGFATDICDLSALASCRMYRGAPEVWQGLSKNATEGLAARGRLLPITVLLVTGQVLAPALALASSAYLGLITLIMVWGPRFVAANRYSQPIDSAFLHPFGILTLLAIQWSARFSAWRGRPASWRGRSYALEG